MDVEEITSEIAAEVLNEVRIYSDNRLEIIWNFHDELQKLVSDLQGSKQDVKLRAKDRGCSFVSGLHDLQKVSGFGFFEGIQQPLINNQQGVLLVLGQKLTDTAVASGNMKIHQQVRKTDVLYREELSGSRHAQCADKIGLSAAGSA